MSAAPTDDDVTAVLSTPVDADTLQRLHRCLAVAAERERLLDVAYTTLDTPVGSLLLAATDKGLVRVAYEREDHDKVLTTLADRISARILRAPHRLDAAVREIDEYFAGNRTGFDLPLDFSLSHGFREQVQRYLSQIAYGHTASYKDVAVIVGKPKAVRAVGTACAANPLPIVVPCHRVLRTDGSLGGYIGGPAAKTALLEMERGA
jgi:methylated-DNA-[protein]-cysteine S-methyltransferase